MNLCSRRDICPSYNFEVGRVICDSRRSDARMAIDPLFRTVQTWRKE